MSPEIKTIPDGAECTSANLLNDCRNFSSAAFLEVEDT